VRGVTALAFGLTFVPALAASHLRRWRVQTF
jgi:hypothetical protein